MSTNTPKAGLGFEEMGSFFENMAMMIKAGITTNEAVGLLKEETEPDDRIMLHTLTELSEQMSAGSSLEDAMRAARDILTGPRAYAVVGRNAEKYLKFMRG